ncbi:hypothetical protein A3A70_02150 [candidate division WWE3 bacterium RIFCSPLOWO2_01_FULL_42_11]|uniref:Uncharacterized protein n=1 Tax=candidate division WWE3 bacterium RIFCSPLOWO2_01_FULL_42_11 TaxID=1802627 RepID=A0A1F4VQU6_UNCKA|nr:MAG: hypothetical protein A3A70_02150 [candidate division WWE3 bacterium RIFCSPLOWO2_01_FULL_42_11]
MPIVSRSHVFGLGESDPLRRPIGNSLDHLARSRFRTSMLQEEVRERDSEPICARYCFAHGWVILSYQWTQYPPAELIDMVFARAPTQVSGETILEDLQRALFESFMASRNAGIVELQPMVGEVVFCDGLPFVVKNWKKGAGSCLIELIYPVDNNTRYQLLDIPVSEFEWDWEMLSWSLKHTEGREFTVLKFANEGFVAESTKPFSAINLSPNQ